MKTNKMKITTILLVTLGLFGFAACAKKAGHDTHNDTRKEQKILYYTCSMHPQIHQDHPGNCPICGMTLIPVYQEEQPIPQPPFDKGGQGGIFISPERQQLIGIKTTPAVKKTAFKEIRTTGRVAFDPDLAIAQREFLEIAKNVPSLRDSAISRLRLMGMSEQEIRELEKVATNLYLPKPGDTLWIYATLYQDEMNLVSPGQEASISLPSHPKMIYQGRVRSVDPVVDPMTRTVRARIETRAQSLKPNTYVDVTLKQNLGESLLIPKSALIDTGTRKIAFLVHDRQYFESREIKTGAEAGDEVVVLDGLKEGEEVVSSATFLVDSESRLKESILGMVEHQHD